MTNKIIGCIGLLFLCGLLQAQSTAQLKKWLAQDVTNRTALRDEPFSKKPLNKKEAANAAALFLEDVYRQQQALLRTEWDNKRLILNDDSLKFEYKISGDKPADGRSLYISMHGGGNTAPRVNDQQWQNQIRLYTPAEGVYVAPRAPTNTWNLWHESHIDTLFDRLILAAVLFEGGKS